MATWRARGSKKRNCPFSSKKIAASLIDFKNFKFLRRFTTENYKIIPSRTTGVNGIYQRKIRIEIMHARYLGLIPYCDNH